MERPRIVLFGDSITQFSFNEGGFGCRLQEKYARHADILLRGFSGYNTAWALCHLEDLSKSALLAGPDAVVIFFGANDSAQTGPQHVPLKDYAANLETIGRAWEQKSANTKVVIITPPAIDAEKWGNVRNQKSSRENKVTSQYAEAARAVAKKAGWACVDLYGEMLKSEAWKKYLNDGLHLSKAGNGLVFTLLAAALDSMPSIKMAPTYEECHIPLDGPLWSAISPESPMLAFSTHKEAEMKRIQSLADT